jgi:uncharacterized membrane protein YbhN (UPF0104 family)
VGVSALLLGLIFWMAGVQNVVHGLLRFPLWAVTGMLAFLLANLLMVSFRFWRVLAHFGIALPWRIAFKANVAGNIAGFFVISLVGHVMGRHMVLQRFGVSPLMNATLAAYERALLVFVSGGLGTLGGMYLLGQAAVTGFFTQIALAEIVTAACGGVILSLWLGRSKFERRLSRQVFSSSNLLRLTKIVALTLAGQLLMLGAFVLGILGVTAELPFVSMFAASAAISLAATIPITVGGWGLREVAAVYVLGLLGVPSADALSVSVMVGLCVTLITLAASPVCLSKGAHV